MNKNTGVKKMKTKRYTLETYPTDFWGAYTVIYDNEKDRYYVSKMKKVGVDLILKLNITKQKDLANPDK
jgi:hypothetical protein